MFVRQVSPQKYLYQVSVGGKAGLHVLDLGISLFACLRWAEPPTGDAHISPLAAEIGIQVRW